MFVVVLDPSCSRDGRLADRRIGKAGAMQALHAAVVPHLEGFRMPLVKLCSSRERAWSVDDLDRGGWCSRPDARG